MYFEYLKERYGQEIIEHDDGFLLYHYEKYGQDNVISLDDIWVKPDKRGTKSAWELYDLAKANGKVNNCKYMLAYVETSLPEAKKRLITYLVRLGFDIFKSEIDRIVLFKEI